MIDRANIRNINQLFTVFVTDIFPESILFVIYLMFSIVALDTFFRKGIWNVLSLCILTNVSILPSNLNNSLDRN